MAKWLKGLGLLAVLVLVLGACSTDSPGSSEDSGESSDGESDDSIKLACPFLH